MRLFPVETLTPPRAGKPAVKPGTSPRAQPRMGYRCKTEAMSAPQNRDGSGRWRKGVSGNPGGRPKGQAELSRTTRELVGEDGRKLVQLWWDIARDETRRNRDRLEASKLLADRGWGKVGVYEPQEGDPFDFEDVEAAAEEFRRMVLRLAPDQD